MKQLLKLLLIATTLWGLAAQADERGDTQGPASRGIIRDANLSKGWVTIDSRRYRVNERTRIRDMVTGGQSQWALHKGLPVRFSANRERELLEIWVYPADPALRQRLEYDPAEFQN